MTVKELNEIEKRCALTTIGPWISFIEGRDHECGSDFIMTGVPIGGNIESKNRGNDIEVFGATNADQDFIAHAKQDIPKLIDEIRKLKNNLRNKNTDN